MPSTKSAAATQGKRSGKTVEKSLRRSPKPSPPGGWPRSLRGEEEAVVLPDPPPDPPRV